MRVITGIAKGHSLKWPKSPRIRPTADVVRGAIFSTMDSLSVDWDSVLDLYAGTGSLGIEALSQGAQRADFVEQNPKCCAVIKQNLEHTKLINHAKIYRMAVEKALVTLKENYGIIFIDPPYADASGMTIVGKVALSDLAGENTTIVNEHSGKTQTEITYGNFQRIRFLKHGDTHVSIYQSIGGTN